MNTDSNNVVWGFARLNETDLQFVGLMDTTAMLANCIVPQMPNWCVS